MDGNRFLAGHFEANRQHLRAVAERILGSRSEAEDAVQETWIRLARSDTSQVENLKAWLTTVVSRVCLDQLRSRKARREEPASRADSLPADHAVASDIEIADSVGLAMVVVLEALSPAERVAFVLHDMFDIPFDEIAPLLHRSSAAVRQLASRARRRIQGTPTDDEDDRGRRRDVITAFHAASVGGDFSALLALLDPSIVLRADAFAVAASVARLGDTPPLAPEMHGQETVAKLFNGRARAAQPALLDGEPVLVIAPGGTARTVLDFVIERGRITELSLIADPAALTAFGLQY